MKRLNANIRPEILGAARVALQALGAITHCRKKR